MKVTCENRYSQEITNRFGIDFLLEFRVGYDLAQLFQLCFERFSLYCSQLSVYLRLSTGKMFITSFNTRCASGIQNLNTIWLAQGCYCVQNADNGFIMFIGNVLY